MPSSPVETEVKRWLRQPTTIIKIVY